MPAPSRNPSTTVEATVTSKGQVTLPKELRKRLGIQNGSRIRFSIPSSGPVQVERVLYDLEDLWRMADEGGKTGPVMSFEEMNDAKARRHW
ncbi:MAG TPA: AbrB/MazE/SpoVT family DNA-binding domain-containing protein [Terracidiphilus sp.]|nr:AbrB/MazE/SpoVT family DNA-binding domain-containing protein [Terracidiphilus sp.]